ILERALQNNELPVQVLNFGRPGAETVDHIEILNKYVIPANPDFILLQWFINDVEGRDKSGRPTYLRLIPSSTFTHALTKHSALYYLANDLWRKIQLSTGLADSYEAYLVDNFFDPKSQTTQSANDALEKFMRICKRASIPMGVVLFPNFSESLGYDYPLGFLLDRVLSKCRAEQVQCLDLRGTYANVEPVSSLWVNRFDRHPGPLANKLAAEKISTHFGIQWARSGVKTGTTSITSTAIPPAGAAFNSGG
ncbi:MAG: hypothetical protein ACR2RB_22700, partial [Gammaproteobacteria bacterium]